MDYDKLFADLGNWSPFLKVGVEGFAGAGKTYTSALLAAGLWKRIGSTRPLVIFDTEQSAKFLVPLFASAGIPVKVRPKVGLADLELVMQACNNGYSDVLLIDSLSAVWENFITEYKGNRKKLAVWDWGIIKPLWKQKFATPFIHLRAHVIFTGRAAWEYAEKETEVDGRSEKEIFKSGIKMRAETETAFEPDLVVLMEREQVVEDGRLKAWRTATILKDRSALIDGQRFTNPTYETFAPVVSFLLESPVEAPPVAEGPSLGEALKDPAAESRRERAVLLEKIEAHLVIKFPGATAAAKAARLAMLSEAFGTASWLEVTGLPTAKLTEGLECVGRKRVPE